MHTESGYQSEHRLRHLQEQLTGIFAEDSWPMQTIKTKKGAEHCRLHFDFTSPSLKIEFKYAVWVLFESRTWNRERDQRQLRFHLNCLNEWAVKKNIRDRTNRLYRFQAHQFRHTVGMRLLNDDVPLEVISRLLGHVSVRMTERYAHKRAAQVRAELERTYRRRKTVDAQGNTVKGDPHANDPEVQMIRRGIRGQTLPIGGCGRLVVLGECSHANKCLTCPMWLTSTDDLPKLKSFYDPALRLKQRATLAGNQFVVEQQEHISANLSVRINSLEASEMEGTPCVDDLLGQLRRDLVEAESALEEVRENGLVPAAKYLERTIADLKARLATLEEPA